MTYMSGENRKRCKYFLMGECAFGDKCRYLHEYPESPNKPPFRDASPQSYGGSIGHSRAKSFSTERGGGFQENGRKFWDSPLQDSRRHSTLDHTIGGSTYDTHKGVNDKWGPNYSDYSVPKNASYTSKPPESRQNADSPVQMQFETYELEMSTGSREQRTPTERFDSMTEAKQSAVQEAYKQALLQYNKSLVWRFTTLQVSGVGLNLNSIPSYSIEEVRMGYYVSVANPSYMKDYEIIMDEAEKEFSAALKQLNTTPFRDLINNYKNYIKPANMTKLDVLLSKKLPFNKRKSVFPEHFGSFQIKRPKEPKNSNFVNPWFTKPMLPVPFEFKVELNDEYLARPSEADYPTTPNAIPHMHFLADLCDSQIGPMFFQQNASTRQFDGAYSYDECVSEQDKQQFRLDTFSSGGIPHHPPSRAILGEHYRTA